MKLVFLAAFFALATCEIDLKTFDWSSVVPLNEVKEWREAFPEYDSIKLQHPGTPVPSRRILDGEIADANEYPYMAGVMLHFDTTNSWCGGSLISRNFVLTAAKCVHIVPSASVLLGASNMHNVGENIRVSQIRVHPQFVLDDSINDIATLELSRPADLSSTINLVRLPNRRQVQSTFENQQATILG